MTNALKRTYLSALLLLALLLACFLGGCSAGSGYIGAYESTFVDAQTDKNTLSFTLVINRDNTFTLKRLASGNVMEEYTGYYKSYTIEGKKELLCIMDEKQGSSSWTPFFTLTKLDDGTLMAATNHAAFGVGANRTSISLILFDKA